MKIGCGVVAVVCVVLTGTTAAASQTCGTLGETEATLRDPDFDQTLNVSERVVTHCSRTSDGDEVVTEVYTRSIEGRLALSRRVRRVTTVTSDGSQTVEEVERSSRVSPSEPLRFIPEETNHSVGFATSTSRMRATVSRVLCDSPSGSVTSTILREPSPCFMRAE